MTASVMVFDPVQLQKQGGLPSQFMWPEKDLEGHNDNIEDLDAPIVDLQGFLKGDAAATARAAELIRAACSSHGFFQIINHGVDAELIQATYGGGDEVFNLSTTKKQNINREPGQVNGYSGAHASKYSTKLPWKECFSFGYGFGGYGSGQGSTRNPLVGYLKSKLHDDFESIGGVYQKYGEAMMELSMVLLELLGISLGVERKHYRDFFEDGYAIMRWNLYPYCVDSTRAMGTGPHRDPTSLTILHQDQVGGLQVFTDGKWQAVRPCPNAFVINIGDTLMALTNGRYKSCLHRAVVNPIKDRRSLVYFVCPRKDKVLSAPEELVRRDGVRKYPNFRWADLLNFTQLHYRTDDNTFESFLHHFRASSN